MKKKLIASIVAVLMFAALFIPAYAIDNYLSAEIPYNNIYGHDYYAFTLLNAGGGVASADVFLVCRDVETQQYEYVPRGYMGITSKVFVDSDAIAVGPTVFNDNSAYFVEAITPTVSTAGYTYVYGGGSISIYNGHGYFNAAAPETVKINVNLKNAVNSSAELEKFTGYKKNSAGQTYGSGVYARQAGGDPDLISAIGVDGIKGYIKSSDITPDVNNPMEAMEYMVNFNNNRVIPLYDKEGVRIGSFVLEAMEEEVVAGARQALAEMKAELAKAS